jgi:hypothetical protein
MRLRFSSQWSMSGFTRNSLSPFPAVYR